MILTRQSTDYTCGPAACSTLFKFLNLPAKTEEEMAVLLKTNSPNGTDTDVLGDYLMNNCSAISVGENTYTDGVAIANILNPYTLRGHFVVFLKREGDCIWYYDPSIGEIKKKREVEIRWVSGDGKYNKWSVNYGVHDIDLSGDLNKYRLERMVFVLMEEKYYDNVFSGDQLIINAYKNKGVKVVRGSYDDILTVNNNLLINGVIVRPDDMVWVRFDPTNSIRYYETLRQLSRVRAKFVNPPSSLLSFHEKLSAINFRKHQTYTASSTPQFKKVCNYLKAKKIKDIILKAPSLCGGQGIKIFKDYENNMEEVLGFFSETLVLFGYVLIEEVVAKNNVDTRVLISQTAILGIVDRCATSDGELCGLSGTGVSRKNNGLSHEQIILIARCQYFLSEIGVFFAGLDFLGDDLIEINITSPSALYDLNEVEGISVENIIINQIDKEMGISNSVDIRPFWWSSW